jgi:hypothetical protein
MPEQREWDEAAAQDGAMLHLPFPFEQRAAADRDSLLDLARKRAADPAIFDDDPPVFYAVRASDNTLDYYKTRMMPSTLRNYAEDATNGKGVPFLDAHRSHGGQESCLGRSILGEYQEGATDRTRRVDITFYTQPTLLPEMDAFVKRARGGYAQDVSVGFTGGRFVCSICGGEMYRWWRAAEGDKRCFHLPGFEYEIEQEGGKKKRVMAIALIEDARLGEVSTVHQGANDNAGFLGFKARSLAEAGLLPPQARSAVAARLPHLDLPGHGRAWAIVGADQRAHKEGTMELTQAELDQRIQEATDRALAAERATNRTDLRNALLVAGIAPEDGQDMLPLVRSLADEVVRLRPQAEDGKTYRADLVRDALKEGVRAFGDGDAFDQERQRTRLERMTIDDVKFEMAAWKAIGDRALPGGQATQTGATTPGGSATDGDASRTGAHTSTFKVPASAYSSSRRVGRR